MSHTKIREDKTCLNCFNPHVEDRFCSKCGQENIDSRLSLKDLIIHFFEDLTHYDNAFWKTIKFLLFHPAKLTIEYLSGRRKLYVPPIRLYFFISFVTFFLPSVLPDIDSADDTASVKTEVSSVNNEEKAKKGFTFFGSGKFKTVKELDSIQNSLPQNERMGSFRYKIVKAIVKSSEKKSPDELQEKFNESFNHNLPKAIFIYLPIFGFWLWLFHGKKRWYFFDHAVFTFHYFGFLLLSLTISITFFERMYSYLPEGTFYSTVSNISGAITCLLIIVYFYIAHKRMYQETQLISFIKSTLLLLINITLISSIMVGLAIYSIINIH